MKSILSCVCLLAATAVPLCADDWNWTNIYMHSSAAPPWTNHKAFLPQEIRRCSVVAT